MESATEWKQEEEEGEKWKIENREEREGSPLGDVASHCLLCQLQEQKQSPVRV